MNNVLAYLEKNREKHLNETFECLRFQTISALPEKTDEIMKCGNWLVNKLKSIGLENASLKETGGLPAVYADWLHAGKDKPTIMIYGHYDVQPVDPIEKWEFPPFEPVVKNGFIRGRGTSDDKAQFLPHIFAIEGLMKTNGKLPINIKIFLESEEEGGTGSTTKFVINNKDLLACDAVLISDSQWPVENMPTIIYALRGIAYFQVNIKGPNRDLHSGSFGGKVVNPLNAMAKMVAKLHDENGKITIPGIYDDVVELTQVEKDEFKKIALTDDFLMKDIGVSALGGENGFTTTERNWGRPALDLNGMWGGYQAEGSKTVIPSECGFKISMRLVANQTVEKVAKSFKEYINKICPAGIKAEVEVMHGGIPVFVPIDNPFIKCMRTSMGQAFGKTPMLVREGASIPITATFLSALSAPSLLMGFGVEDDNIHSPNEKIRLDQFYKGSIASAYFMVEAEKIKK